MRVDNFEIRSGHAAKAGDVWDVTENGRAAERWFVRYSVEPRESDTKHTIGIRRTMLLPDENAA